VEDSLTKSLLPRGKGFTNRFFNVYERLISLKSLKKQYVREPYVINDMMPSVRIYHWQENVIQCKERRATRQLYLHPGRLFPCGVGTLLGFHDQNLSRLSLRMSSSRAQEYITYNKRKTDHLRMHLRPSS
jgi:hypothetical protein